MVTPEQGNPCPRMFSPTYMEQISSALMRCGEIPGIVSLESKIHSLLIRIVESEATSCDHPGALYVELDGLLFELKCAIQLLERSSVRGIAYEPPGLDPSGKSLDFTFCDNGTSVGMECKVTNPQSQDRAIPYERFSNDLLVTNELSYSWLSSARSHLLEFLADTEAKLSNYPRFQRSVLCIYMNFYIEDYELEHVWHFYQHGAPAPDDTFSRMMIYELQRKGIVFRGMIDELLGVPFEQYGFVQRNSEEILRLS